MGYPYECVFNFESMGGLRNRQNVMYNISQ